MDVSLVRYSDRNIANSHFTAAAFKRIYGVAANAIAYPGIDFSSLACAYQDKDPVIITVARLTKFKRVDFLLEVFKAILGQRPELIYHIVGTGEEETALRERARQLGVAAQVIFHGNAKNEELSRLYRRASLFLHGSVDEPFGMAPLEAIACGTPVVAHCSGGPAEFVAPGCGRLIATLEVADWARESLACLDELRNDPGLPIRLQEYARRFDWEVSLQPAVEIIAGLCVADNKAANSLLMDGHSPAAGITFDGQ